MKTTKSAAIILLLLFCIIPAFAQDSLNVRHVGQLSWWDDTENIAVQGNYAYVSTWESGLRIVDISDSMHPVEVGYCDFRDGFQTVFSEIAVQGNYAYISSYNYVYVLDISDPTHPYRLNTRIDSRCSDFAIQDSYLYLYGGLWESYFKVYDISNPASPQFVSSVWLAGMDARLILQDTLAYIATHIDFGQDRLFIVDIADPMNLQQIGVCDTEELIFQYGSDICVSNGYAYISDGLYPYLNVIDVRNPAAPKFLSARYIDAVGGMALQDTFLYAVGSNKTLTIMEIADSGHVDSIGSVPLRGDASNLVFHRRNILVADGMAGLTILNATAPAQPVLTGFLDTPGNINDLAVRDSLVYLTADSFLYIMSFSDPEHPLEIGSLCIGAPVAHVVIQDSFAYVDGGTYGHHGFSIINISDPACPTLAGSYHSATSMGLGDLVVQGDHVFVLRFISYADVELVAIDVSDPANPVETAMLPVAWAVQICMSGNFAYVGTNMSTTYIVDISNPANLQETGTIPCSYLEAVVGNHAFIYRSSGLRILDISQPEAPDTIAAYDSISFTDIAVQGDYIYFTGQENFGVVNMSDLNNLFLSGFYKLPSSYSSRVVVSGDYAYVAQLANLGVYDCSAATGISEKPILHPTSFSLSCYPNPFNAVTNISFDLPLTTQVELRIFNTLGQEVTTLFRGVRPAGSYRFTWNGKDTASGVYVCQLKAGDFLETKKLMLLK